MAPPDDLHTDLPPATESAGKADGKLGGTATPPNPLKEVGPESEVRGGAQAPDEHPSGSGPGGAGR